MEPSLKPGDLLVIKGPGPMRPAVGDIIVYRSKCLGNLIIHRVIKIMTFNGKKRIVTKGDAFDNIDPYYLTTDEVIGYVRFRFPWLAIIPLNLWRIKQKFLNRLRISK
jgi:signal peptidase I